MLSPYEYLCHARPLPAGQVRTTLLRVVLNTQFDPQRYPVDLSEVLALPAVDRVVALGYLSGCAACPNVYTRTPTWALEDLCQEIDETLAEQDSLA